MLKDVFKYAFWPCVAVAAGYVIALLATGSL